MWDEPYLAVTNLIYGKSTWTFVLAIMIIMVIPSENLYHCTQYMKLMGVKCIENHVWKCVDNELAGFPSLTSGTIRIAITYFYT